MSGLRILFFAACILSVTTAGAGGFLAHYGLGKWPTRVSVQESYPFVPGPGPFKKGSVPIVTFNLGDDVYGFYLNGKETVEWLDMLKYAYINKSTFISVASDEDSPSIYMPTCGNFNDRGECLSLTDTRVRPTYGVRYYVLPQ